MRLALLTQWFPPEPPGPEFWVAEEMAKRGLETSVVTGVPNYPAGKSYPGYQAWRASAEVISGMPVKRCPLYPSRSSSSSKRALTYMSFAASSTIFGSRLLASADAILVYCSPATAGAAALAVRRQRGTPYVLWIQDLWPDSIFASGFLRAGAARSLAQRCLTSYTRRLYDNAAHIAAITPGMRDLLTTRGVEPKRSSVIYNWTDEAVMRPVTPTGQLRARLGIPANHLLLMYAGGQGFAQKLSAWIEAMHLLRDLTDVDLVFVGDGPDKQNLIAKANGIRNVHFADPVDRPTIAEWIAESDVQIISLADDPLFRVTLPSKTQASLACGKAIIASVGGDLTRVLDESGAGWSAQAENPHSIAACIREARLEGQGRLAQRGASGRVYYLENMSAGRSGDDMAERLLSAAARGRR